MTAALATFSQRIRFSLRSLFLLITVAAAVCWVYWIGWPWLKMQREESQFEKRVLQLKAGVSPFDADNSVGFHSIFIESSGEDGRPIAVSGYFWKDAIYLIYFDSWSPTTDFNSVRVFRLRPLSPECPVGKKDRRVDEFLLHAGEVLSGKKTAEPWLKCELIYADPSAKGDGGDGRSAGKAE